MALDGTHQPALDLIGGGIGPVAEMKILRIVGIACAMHARSRRGGRQGRRIMSDVEIGWGRERGALYEPG
jgi:hypothetical protein